MSNVDIYNISEEDLLEKLEAFASGAVQPQSAYHTRADDRIAFEKEEKKKRESHNQTISQLDQINRQLEQLYNKFQNLLAEQARIEAALKENQTNLAKAENEAVAIGDELDDAIANANEQAEIVEQAEEDLEKAQENHEQANANFHEAHDAAYEAGQAIDETAIENSNLVVLDDTKWGDYSNQDARAVGYDKETGQYYVIQYYDYEDANIVHENGQKHYITDQETIAEIERQIADGKKLTTDADVSSEDLEINNAYMDAVKHEVTVCSHEDEAIAELENAEEELVEASICLKTEQDTLDGLEKIRDDIETELKDKQKEIDGLKTQKEKLESDQQNNNEELNELKEQIKKLEAQKNELTSEMSELDEMSEDLLADGIGDGSCQLITTSDGLGKRLSEVFEYNAFGEEQTNMIAAADTDNSADQGNESLGTMTYERNFTQEFKDQQRVKLENHIKSLGKSAITANQLQDLAQDFKLDVSPHEFSKLQDKLYETMPELKIIPYIEGDFRSVASANTSTFNNSSNGNTPTQENNPDLGPNTPSLQQSFEMNGFG